jgi:dipeptidyl aminopeptidase/acylaminoacyl peptidase
VSIPSKILAPYGSWRSPITPDVIVADSVRPSQGRLAGTDVYWLEGRPQESGRTVIVRLDASGRGADVIPPELNARDRVHEYGGGSYAVDGDTLYVSNFSDDRVYRLERSGAPRPITPGVGLRYSDFTVDARRGRLVAVREDHRASGREAVNTLVALDVDGETEGRILVSGNDFYSTPRLSAEGSRLAWLAWNHPNMPWDGTELWTAQVTPGGDLTGRRLLAGGRDESIFQPEWSPDGSLFFVSDRTGWWNLYRWDGDDIEAVTREEAELGVPQWVFDMRTYGFAGPEKIVCVVNRANVDHLALLDLASSARPARLEAIASPYTSIDDIRVSGGRVLVIGSSPVRPPEVAQLDLASGRWEILRRSARHSVGEEYFSRPQPIEFPTTRPQGGDHTAHAFYYPPHNPDFAAPQGELPPLIVASHGGPIGAAKTGLELEEIQYWTSRGFAVVDVNYGGSTGYGRAYRERLKGQWGVVDVDDCVNAARYLVAAGMADATRLIIHGGSAGGYTTLSALAFRDVFRAGASYYGIGDLEVFLHDSHKFESRDLEILVGPFPECAELYRERSAIYHVDGFSCPVIFFHGEDDTVVPPNQTALMVEALDKKGLPNAAIYFPGEGHGFRRAESSKRALEAELYFYSRVFGLELAEAIEPVEISNL